MPEQNNTTLNPPYSAGLNAILKQGNTNLVVVKEQPLFDVNNTELSLEEKQYVNLITLSVQHGEDDGNNITCINCRVQVYTHFHLQL